MSDSLTCRRLEPEEAALAMDLFHFLLPMHAEAGLAPFDEAKAIGHIAWVIENGRVFLLKTHDGEWAGSVGLCPGDLWYARRKIYLSNWLYLAPAWRDSGALRMLLLDIIDMVEDERTPAFLHLFGAEKLNRTVRKLAEELAVFPSGEILAVKPKGAV